MNAALETSPSLVEPVIVRKQTVHARGSRWTLVDSFERNGARYIVARENVRSVEGLDALTARERQAVVCLARGQSTKETAFALGISDVTVRVLVRRAAAKVGARSRSELFAHPEVRALCRAGRRP